MNSKPNKITDFLIYLSEKFKFFATAYFIYCIILVLYNIIFQQISFPGILFEYAKTLIISILIWFGVKFVFWVQIKNPLCNDTFFNLASICILAGILIISVSAFITYFQGFNNGAFIFPVAALSVIRIQKSRK